MSIYHHNVKLISRKAGRSSTAAAAYRAGEKITDARTGEIHDYSRKRDVVSADIIMPAGITWTPSRSELWNAVEKKNGRADAQVAREFVIALPHELNSDQRSALAKRYAQALADDYQIAVDVALHKPGKTSSGNSNKNWHAHLLTTTNKVTNDPKKQLGNKARELDPIASKKRIDPEFEDLKTSSTNAVDYERGRWASFVNEALVLAGVHSRVDHRSYEAQGLDDEPTVHLGPTAAAMERRKAGSSRIGCENQERQERNLIRELMAQDIQDDKSQIWYMETELEVLGDESEKLEIEIELKQGREAREAVQQTQEAARQAEAVKRGQRQSKYLDGLQERIRPLIEQTIEFMREFGFPVSDDLLERFRKKDEPEQLTPLQKAQRDFDLENGYQTYDFDDDEPGGPSLG